MSTNTPTSWSWALPGGTPGTSTLQNPVVVYNTPGTYNVTLTAISSAGCSTPLNMTGYISVITCTGLESLTSPSADIFIYPNPSNSSFKIELASDAKVSISNAIGQLVMNTSILAGTHTILLNDVSEGIYFVKVISGNTQTIKRLVVSK